VYLRRGSGTGQGAGGLGSIGADDEGAMMYLAYQERVVEEQKELSEKLYKLQTFNNGPTFSALPAAEQVRLMRQYLTMSDYLQVLKERIAAFRVL
jgi:hypothetical protein